LQSPFLGFSGIGNGNGATLSDLNQPLRAELKLARQMWSWPVDDGILSRRPPPGARTFVDHLFVALPCLDHEWKSPHK
jgi:hypothetical protein